MDLTGFVIIYYVQFQCVKLGSVQSVFILITKGVSQGSILGPVLFTIYIIDIVSLVRGCQIHTYADYTISYSVADPVKPAIEKLQLHFIAIEDALVSLKVVLNKSKTRCMFLSARYIDDYILCIMGFLL